MKLSKAELKASAVVAVMSVVKCCLAQAFNGGRTIAEVIIVGVGIDTSEDVGLCEAG